MFGIVHKNPAPQFLMYLKYSTILYICLSLNKIQIHDLFLINLSLFHKPFFTKFFIPAEPLNPTIKQSISSDSYHYQREFFSGAQFSDWTVLVLMVRWADIIFWFLRINIVFKKGPSKMTKLISAFDQYF